MRRLNTTPKVATMIFLFQGARCKRVVQHAFRNTSSIRPWLFPTVFLLLFACFSICFRSQTLKSYQSGRYRYDSTESVSVVQNILSQPFAADVIVSEVNKLIYCPIPKAASSNWKYLIRKLEGFPDYADLLTAHNRNKSSLRYLTDYSPHEVKRLLTDKQYFKFAFVRNPYLRLLSCYMDKFRNLDRNYTTTEYIPFLADAFSWRYARSVDPQTDPRPSFRAFINAIYTADPGCMNHHWRPQTLLCGFGFIEYDFIGRMENLSADAHHVLAAIGHPQERFPTHHEINFPPSGASLELAQRLYSAEMMFKVRTLYAEDFHYLHYDYLAG